MFTSEPLAIACSDMNIPHMHLRISQLCVCQSVSSQLVVGQVGQSVCQVSVSQCQLVGQLVSWSVTQSVSQLSVSQSVSW